MGHFCVRQAERFRKEGHAYDGRPVSKWMGQEHEHRAVFVDETTCVGCRHCTYCAPNTFGMARIGSLHFALQSWCENLS